MGNWSQLSERSQSLLHQVNLSNPRETFRFAISQGVGLNPFFIRSISPTPGAGFAWGFKHVSQSLLHQVNLSNDEKKVECHVE